MRTGLCFHSWFLSLPWRISAVLASSGAEPHSADRPLRMDEFIGDRRPKKPAGERRGRRQAMPAATLIGIDVGTTTIKAALVDVDGRLLKTFARPYVTRRPAPGHVEQ